MRLPEARQKAKPPSGATSAAEAPAGHYGILKGGQVLGQFRISFSG